MHAIRRKGRRAQGLETGEQWWPRSEPEIESGRRAFYFRFAIKLGYPVPCTGAVRDRFPNNAVCLGPPPAQIPQVRLSSLQLSARLKVMVQLTPRAAEDYAVSDRVKLLETGLAGECSPFAPPAFRVSNSPLARPECASRTRLRSACAGTRLRLPTPPGSRLSLSAAEIPRRRQQRRDESFSSAGAAPSRHVGSSPLMYQLIHCRHVG